MPNQCTSTTKSGRPCRAWAIRDSDPPRCSIHSGRTRPPGPPLNNTNRKTHGFYATSLSPTELADLVLYADDLTLDDEIACARVALRRVLDALTTTTDQPDRQLDAESYARLAAVAFQGTRTVARLLRDQRALSGQAADGIAGAIAQALDELGSEWGLEL